MKNSHLIFLKMWCPSEKAFVRSSSWKVLDILNLQRYFFRNHFFLHMYFAKAYCCGRKFTGRDRSWAGFWNFPSRHNWFEARKSEKYRFDRYFSDSTSASLQVLAKNSVSYEGFMSRRKNPRVLRILIFIKTIDFKPSLLTREFLSVILKHNRSTVIMAHALIGDQTLGDINFTHNFNNFKLNH